MAEGPLGRRKPPDDEHIRRYGFAAVEPKTVEHVEKVLALPWWYRRHNQGKEGSCAGHGPSMERAIVNGAQNRKAGLSPWSRWYDPIFVWNEAKKIDGFPDTNPGDDEGTTVRAAYDVIRIQGLCRVRAMKLVNDVPVPIGKQPVSRAAGGAANRWATTTDQIRTAISESKAVAIGIDWFENFDQPVKDGNDFWIGRGDLGRVRGGHCVCLYGASDRRQGFKFVNNWGAEYPLTWLPYETMQTLLERDGEAAIVVDR